MVAAISFLDEQIDQNLIYQDPSSSMEIRVPPGCLAPYSVEVIPKEGNLVHISEGTYTCLQKIDRAIGRQFSYLIYNCTKTQHPDSFNRWEFVPYKKASGSFLSKIKYLWQQITVLWRIIFGPKVLSKSTKQKVINEYKRHADAFTGKLSQMFPKPEIDQKCQKSFFCNQKNRKKQTVILGKTIDVLYDYAPIGFGSNRLHFLVITKTHKTDFSELSSEEYVEAEHLIQSLISHYDKKGYQTVYRYHKKGIEAGQTVPHWHQHVIFIKNKRQDRLGKFDVFKRMLFGAKRLSPKELAKQVKVLKDELKEIDASPT